MNALTGGKCLAVGAQRHIAGKILEEEALKIFETGKQRRSDQPCGDAHHDSVAQIATDHTQLEPLY